MAQDNNIVAVLDAEIEKLERRIRELEAQLPALKAERDAYRKIRNLMPATVHGENDNNQKYSRMTAGSIGALALEVLKEDAVPMHVSALLDKIREKGKPDLKEATLVSTLCTYRNAGKLTRTAPNTYALQ
jgi:hypothetical protein